MTRTVVVIVPGIPPGANALHRMGHWGRRKSREEWKGTTLLSLMAQVNHDPNYPRHPFHRAHVGVLWRFQQRRKRDFDNLVSGLKPLLDGLVAGGILEDDSTDHILTLGPLATEVGAMSNEVVLTVREA